MNNHFSFLITNDTVTVIPRGGAPVVVRRDAANYAMLRAACVADDGEAIQAALTTNGALMAWAKGDFTVDGDSISYKGEKLPQQLNKRILEMVAKNESPEPFFKFWERLQLNPSARSVEQLFPFLEHQGIPLTADGCFLAYKGVTDQLKDQHTKTIDNSPGVVNEMPRNKISDDPNQGCHFGYHVGALAYAISFGARCVICKVDPADVVCIPYDSSYQKMRVCKYTVEGHYSGQMSSTVHDEAPDASYGDEDMKDECENCGSVDCIDMDVCEGDGGEDAEDAPFVYYNSEKAEQEHNENEVEVSAPKNKLPNKFKKIHAMSMLQLLQQPIADLRAYATHGLKIVGASKIPGGKAPLVSKICDVRNFSE